MLHLTPEKVQDEVKRGKGGKEEVLSAPGLPFDKFVKRCQEQ